MTYTPTQLDIIRRFGKKELTEGCIVIASQCDSDGTPLCDRGFTYIHHTELAEIEGNKYHNLRHWNLGGVEYEEYGILGHIPEIFPDVARVAEEEGYVNVTIDNDSIRITTTIKITPDSFWKIKYTPTLQLLDQPESTLQELLSLFPN